jgi:hypothetical protein
MRRILTTLAATGLTLVLFAGRAMAQYPPTTPPGGGGAPGGGGGGGGGGGAGGGGGGGGTAFTGISLSLGLIIVGVLLVVGVAALVASRRRSSPQPTAE